MTKVIRAYHLKNTFMIIFHFIIISRCFVQRYSLEEKQKKIEEK
jgi:hypothetical protein